jgi:hypothetical protein
MTIRKHVFVIAALATAALTACGSRGSRVAEAEPPEPTANARNAVVLPAISYGKTNKGVQLTKADDACDVPASLNQAIQDQLLAPTSSQCPHRRPT